MERQPVHYWFKVLYQHLSQYRVTSELFHLLTLLTLSANCELLRVIANFSGSLRCDILLTLIRSLCYLPVQCFVSSIDVAGLHATVNKQKSPFIGHHWPLLTIFFLLKPLRTCNFNYILSRAKWNRNLKPYLTPAILFWHWITLNVVVFSVCLFVLFCFFLHQGVNVELFENSSHKVGVSHCRKVKVVAQFFGVASCAAFCALHEWIRII